MVLNMVGGLEEIASTLMESEVLEILSVLAKDKESPAGQPQLVWGKQWNKGLSNPARTESEGLPHTLPITA